MRVFVRSVDLNGVIVAEEETGYAVAQFFFGRGADHKEKYPALALAERFMDMVNDSKGAEEAIVNGTAVEQDTHDLAAVICYAEADDNEDWRDNLTLIAAAPELLAACEALVNRTGKWDELYEAQELARTALAKARGK